MESDWSIHILDAIAGPSLNTPGLQTFHCSSKEIHAAIMPAGTWHWRVGTVPYHGSVLKLAQRHHFRQYTQKRDMKQYANEQSRWTRRYNPSLIARLTKTKTMTLRQRGRRSKHLFDWMAHAHNLAKGAPVNQQEEHSRCSFCGLKETQQHINVHCMHLPLVEVRRAHKRHVDEFFQCYRHHPLL